MNRNELAKMLKDVGIERCVSHMDINPTEWVYTRLSYSPDGEVKEFSMEKSYNDDIAACINYPAILCTGPEGKVNGEWYGDVLVNGMQSSNCDASNSTFDNLADAIEAAEEVAELELEAEIAAEVERELAEMEAESMKDSD
ncbi:MAG: hypothetical protein M0Z36_05160 [Thermaerobacter sp.]|nr:hypothetical protein [Thermaerobacter sp.]